MPIAHSYNIRVTTYDSGSEKVELQYMTKSTLDYPDYWVSFFVKF